MAVMTMEEAVLCVAVPLTLAVAPFIIVPYCLGSAALELTALAIDRIKK